MGKSKYNSKKRSRKKRSEKKKVETIRRKKSLFFAESETEKKSIFFREVAKSKLIRGDKVKSSGAQEKKEKVIT